MHALHLISAGFLLASAMFIVTMLVTPPKSEAALGTLELVGP